MCQFVPQPLVRAVADNNLARPTVAERMHTHRPVSYLDPLDLVQVGFAQAARGSGRDVLRRAVVLSE